ncbi:polysaccharide biosynthesis/export family protein [uncultured Dokdonia sp.]|uniref:polysaccharide biosynthesis/export family protein n=1 Tax=uncultured Dokdonia sp. TaxID=575653 RepID=UPI0026322ECE|nr:polysaccharide biosynthesis/export family protein [uncultured Dokdonia sp.]
MKIYIKFSILLLAISTLTTSCVSKKKVLYLQDIEQIADNPANTNYNISIRANDLLTINVSALNPEAVAPFNQPLVGRTSIDGIVQTAQQLQTYLVSVDGTIEFPMVGTIALSGLTRTEATEKVKELISKYVKNPIVNIRILNFKVSVLGEVQRPGTFTINDERITVLEALGLSGDMTIFGDRKNVKIIREIDGVKTYGELDFTSSSIIDSPFYYLQQNDVVIVSPNQAQIQSSSFNRNTSVFISIAGIIISVISVLTRN